MFKITIIYNKMVIEEGDSLKKGLITLMLISVLLIGCSNKEENNKNTDNNTAVENVEEAPKAEEEITVYHALGNTYEGSKDIMNLNEGDQIYDLLGGNAHVRGEYLEIDFASDLVKEYLFKNQDVYNYIVDTWNNSSEEVILIAGDAKDRVVDSANFLGEQFGLSNEAPVYFRLDKVILQEKYEDGVSLEMRGHLSATDGNYRPLGTFTVDVYKKGDKLYATII